MSLNRLKKGQRLKVRASEFLILQKLPDSRWQLQDCATEEVIRGLVAEDILQTTAEHRNGFSKLLPATAVQHFAECCSDIGPRQAILSQQPFACVLPERVRHTAACDPSACRR